MEVTLNGVDVNFPYEPYDIQKEYMRSLISAIQGGKNALLESPTGTGKTLSALCSALAWLKQKKQEIEDAKEETKDEVGVEVEQPIPKIYFWSRTHSQLSQVINEIKNTEYEPTIAVLASRGKMWVNPDARDSENVDEKWNKLRKSKRSQPPACKFFRNYPSHVDQLKEKDNYEIRDIEEINAFAFENEACAYFSQKELAQTADIVIMPYNYLLYPYIREAFRLKITDAVIIIDEAHNIDSASEQVASQNFSETSLSIILDQIQNFPKLVSKQKDYLDNSEFLASKRDFENTTKLVKGLMKYLDTIWKAKEWEFLEQLTDNTLTTTFENVNF